PFWAMLARSRGRGLLLRDVTVFAAVVLVAFRIAGVAAIPGVGVTFHVVGGILGAGLLALVGAVAVDVADPTDGVRELSRLALGPLLGGIAGSLAASGLAGAIGAENLLLVAAAVLLATSALPRRIERDAWLDPAAPDVADPPPVGRRTGFQLVLASPYLRVVAGLALLAGCAMALGDYLVGRAIAIDALARVNSGTAGGLREGEWIARAFARIGIVAGVGAVLAQLVLVSPVLRRAGLGAALAVGPVLALAGAGVVAVAPSLVLLPWIRGLDLATRRSLDTTARWLLFLPTSREERYGAKPTIDTLFVAFGEALAAAILYVGTRSGLLFGAAGPRRVALAASVLAILWLAFAVRAARLHRRQSPADADTRPISEAGRTPGSASWPRSTAGRSAEVRTGSSRRTYSRRGP
ncbi:MAG: hypothetical protein KC591_10190, partial [Gemmatimonadetes bacterium]|nr:hypothetical protein [Gemmatimonadota bacterium]